MSEALADGQWHRLHPLTPLLRGGIFVIAVLGVLIANLRDRIVEWLFGEAVERDLGVPGPPPDFIDYLTRRGLLTVAILVVSGVLVLLLVLGLVSWRMRTFRIGPDAVEERSGLLNRRHRQARMDRIQGVNVQRPFLARLLGLARLKITTAGQDADIDLAYLTTAQTEGLRLLVLQRAAGRRAEQDALSLAPEPGAEQGRPEPPGAQSTAEARSEADRRLTALRGAGRQAIARRLDDFLAPELDPGAAPVESVVRIPVLRLLGAIVLSTPLVVIVVATAVFAYLATHGMLWTVFLYGTVMLSAGSILLNRLIRTLRFSIAGTAQGIRIGFGLFSIVNDTLPERRIHAVEVRQPLLWRPFGWWTIRVNKAGEALAGSAQASTNTLLPVGDRQDVRRVLGLILPELGAEALEAVVRSGLPGRGTALAAPATTTATAARLDFRTLPRRAAVLRPFTWRRNGVAAVEAMVLLRHGILARSLSLFPLVRAQGAGVEQGVVQRVLGLATLRVHVVAGPVRTWVTGLDRAAAMQEFSALAERVREAVAAERRGRDSAA